MSEEKVAGERPWEFVILHHPTKKDRKAGERSKVIAHSDGFIMASSAEAAGLAAARAIPADYAERLDELEVILRPF